CALRMLSSVTAAARAPSAGRTNEPGCLNECVRLPSANFTHPSHASRRRPAFPRCSIARSASERLSTISRTERDRLARSEGRREVSLTSAGEGGRKERAEKSEPRRASREERAEKSGPKGTRRKLRGDKEIGRAQRARLFRIRHALFVALVAGGAEFVLQQHRILQGNALYLLEGVCGYIAVITAVALFVQKTGRAPNWSVAVTVIADILFIFGSTLVSSPPFYYDRILI